MAGADPFLDEVKAMHDLRARYHACRNDEERAAFVAPFADRLGDWVFQARDAQLPPLDLGRIWVMLGGRGSGKSHALSGAAHIAIQAGLSEISAICPTKGSYYDIFVAGPAGLCRPRGSAPTPRYVEQKRRLIWPNGAVVQLFSAEEPDALRGSQFELCLVDEMAAMRRQEDIFDNAMMGLRLGARPRMLIATTPQPTLFMKKLIKMEGVSITKGTTFDNARHLSPSYLESMRALKGRRALQEINGDLLLDPVNALFRDEWLRREDIPEAAIEQATVGVDPSGGADSVGIVVAGLLTDGRIGILADRTCAGKPTPSEWGEAVVKAYDDFDCDDCVVEINFGGDMALDVVRRAAEDMCREGRRSSNLIKIREVTASRGKVMRAEPVSLLMERGRIVLAHGLDRMEAEFLQFSRDWDRDKDGSPNRLDAAVWAAMRLSKIVTELPIA